MAFLSYSTFFILREATFLFKSFVLLKKSYSMIQSIDFF
ncbi:hypothetical protein FM106_31860 [Brachybacterium faecium]|nr:hypothetical protein FM106_31860 [Brachybacterium faecium]